MAVALSPMAMVAQTYTSLWNQEKDAERKDLPKTQMKVLRQIEDKAAREHDYGQMLKAGLKAATIEIMLSPDSLKPVVTRFEARERTAQDSVLKAVYATVLYRLYKDNRHSLGDEAQDMADMYRRHALANPDMLAEARTSDYEPMVVKGYNASVFGSDMLSVIGYEVEDFKTLHDWYHKAGQMRAACITGLELLRQHRPSGNRNVRKSDYLMWLDSLLTVYSDLDVTGEAAIERYDYLTDCRDVTIEDKISYIHYALDKWGGWQRSNYLREEERRLTAPGYQVSMMSHDVVTPSVSQTIDLKQLRNLSSLTMNVYRADVDGSYSGSPDYDNDYRALKPKLTLLPDKGQTRTFMGHPEYELFADSIVIGPMRPGVYMLEFVSVPATQTKRVMYYVSDVSCMMLPLPGDSVRYVVVNATTGQPLPGAKIRLSTRQNNKVQPVTLTCEANGEAIYTRASVRRERVFAYTDNDKYAREWANYGSFSYYEREGKVERTAIFTDRRIYRPGQTVHVAAVVYENKHGIENNAVARKTVKAVLRDANHKVVEEKELVTDSYGSCSADFALPVGGLYGNYVILVNNSVASIKVEEYKRPTFYVEFPKINEKYANGDTLAVRAKALTYAGVPVQGAQVSYTVQRKTALWWRYCSPYGYRNPGETIFSGTATTADDGTFEVDVPMILPDDNDYDLPGFYEFVVEADVTDTGGETRSGSMSVPLGTRTTVLTSTLPDKVLADSLTRLEFNLRNAAGMDISADVRFRFDGSGEWLTARTTEPYLLGESLASGRYHLTAICESDTLEQDFIVFSLDDSVPCTDTRDWFYVSSESFPRDGSPVTVQVGSSDEDVHIVYTIISGDKTIESGSVDKSNGLINRKLTYKEEYGNGLMLNFAWVKDGHCYTHDVTIARPLPDKRLTMKWTTFRDRLTPGQQEEWSLSVTKPDGTPADALLMATMYDKSLDQIARHDWRFEPYTRLPQPFTTWYTPGNYSFMLYAEQSWKSLNWRNFEPSRFDNTLFPATYGYFSGRVSGAGRRVLRAKELMAGDEDELKAHYILSSVEKKEATNTAAQDAVFNAVAPEAAQESADEDGGMGGDGSVTDVQPRENFNETALFYPSARTDSKGAVTLTFTLPESLTTWRFMGMAHTTDMFSGLIEGEAVAKKDVMVQPNVPRFVRVGDKASITARIFNTGEAEASGKATMELTDPETGKVIHTQTRSFKVAQDSTAAVTFDYSPDGSHSLLVCKIVIAGKAFGDGEQCYLPVLPDRERVTVTMPFTQNGPGTKTIDMGNLFPVKDKTSKLTVEYTNNPAWLVVQALPTMGTPDDDNAIAQAASLYANTLGEEIVRLNPEAKKAFDRWRMERGEETSLMSSLEKNSSLKDIVLAETPWVADADRETEQKQLLAGFFNESLMASRKASAADKLARLQKADGSWGWCDGMSGSFHLTVAVSEMLVRMNAMTGKQNAAGTMLDNAFGYMGTEIVKRVDEMKKSERKGAKVVLPGTTTLQYLYLSAVDGRKQSAKVQSACDYLVALLKKDIAGQSIYEKAMTAVILAKRGETTKSREYAQSLKEYTVYTDEAGRYYDTPRAGYSWFDYRIPTEVAAIEAIKTVTPEDTNTIDEMRRWLLHEKRTQAWDTPINSVNAVYAFLMGNSKALSSREQTVLAIDGKTLETPEATAGLGYMKTAIAEPKGKTFTATKTSEGTSWGALYAQYMQKTSEIESANAGISVKRDILVKGADGKTHEAKELNVGDRVVVRITINSSLDLDFVQIVDRRAACMEPVKQLSGYSGGVYRSPKDNATCYYLDRLAKGKHIIETEYYIDRAGTYETGTCTAGCAYAPEYRATAKSQTIKVK